MPERPLKSGATDYPDAPQSEVDYNESTARAAGYEVHHDNSLRQVNGPQGPINFPSSMSDEQVTQAMRKLYPPKQQVPEAVMTAHTPTLWEKAKEAVPVLKGEWMHHPMAPEDASQLVYPERTMTPTQREAHPIATGVGEFAGGLSSPDNILLMATMAKTPAMVARLASLYFTGQMGKGSYDAFQAGLQKYRTGDVGEAERLWTHAGLNLMAAGLAARHAIKGVPAPTEAETPIAASGKTVAEAKTEQAAATSSPKTGLNSLSADQIRARMRAFETRQAPAPKPAAEDAVEQIRRGAPLEAAKPLENQVPEADRASKLILKDEQEKIAQRIEGRTEQKKALEAQSAAPSFDDAKIKASMATDKDIEKQALASMPKDAPLSEKIAKMMELKKAAAGDPVLPKAPEARTPRSSIPERPANIMTGAETSRPLTPGEQMFERTKELRDEGLTEPEQVFKLVKEFPDQTDQIARAYGIKSSGGPKVGRQVTPPETTQPASESVSPTEATPKTRESVQSASAPAVSEPRSLRGDLGERTPTPPVNQPEPPALKKVSLGAMDRLKLQRVKVEELQKKFPGVAKARLQEMAAEQIKKETGSLGGDLEGDRQSRREAKINQWVKTLQDADADPRDIDAAFKMLKAFGLEPDEIIRRVSGAEGFAETEPQGLPEPSKEALEERIGDPKEFSKAEENSRREVHDQLERLATNFRQREGREPNDSETNKLYLAAREAAARDQGMTHIPVDPSSRGLDLVRGEGLVAPSDREAARAGSPSVRGVKDPGLEELDRIAALEDLRDQVEKKSREGERGSISFKRISDEERKAANPVRRLADALDRVADFFANRGLTPEEVDRQQTAKNIIRKAGAGLARSHQEVMAALDEHITRHDSPANERENFVQFMDAGEGKEGAQFLNPVDQALAGELHRMFEDKWDRVKEVKGLEGEGIENYLSHIWEKADKAGKLLTGLLMGKRPLEGSARFLKNRFYQYASTGIEHGLTPVTWNPIRLQLAALFDTDRFLMAHGIKDQYLDAGLAKWVKFSDYKNVPAGWQKLNDKIFQPRVVGDGALKEFGTYYAPAEVAGIFNRYLSPGLAGNPVFRSFRNYGNTLNMINLGFSGYHATMISLVSATSDLSLGLQKVLNYGDTKGGVKDMLRGSVGTFIMRSAANDYRLGRAIQAEAIDPTGNVSLQKFVDAITTGGGRFKQDAWYSNAMVERKGFVNWLKLGAQGKFQEMAFTGVRAASAPIMDKFVPRVKVGVAARMMEAKIADLHSKGITDENTVATELGKIWDSVDNRAGQMVYDNLFWNRTIKDLAFTAVRAVGWDLGSLREYGGAALVDAPREAAKALRGTRPELTARMAFTIATPITIGLFGGAVHYLMTGKAPQKSEDYFFPGPDGAKVSFPTYMKDYYSFKDHPMKTAINKLHPTWGQLVDLYNNADFYGTEIYHPGDDKTKQGLDIMKWYGESWSPLSYRGMEKRIERGETIGSAATGLFGFMPAPASVSQSKAEQLAAELSSREWKRGPRTSGDADRHALVQSFQRRVGAGQKLDPTELTKAWQEKRIQDTDLTKIYSNFNVPYLQQEFKGLSIPDALAVMREAKPEERVQLKTLLLQKYDQLERYPLDQQQAYDREIRAYLQ